MQTSVPSENRQPHTPDDRLYSFRFPPSVFLCAWEGIPIPPALWYNGPGRHDIMKKCRITVIRKANYPDLSARYENPLEEPCTVQEGQVFIANG